MTTKITIEPAGHHILYCISDRYKSPAGLFTASDREEVILPASLGGQPVDIYVTTTRELTIKDIEPDDDRAIEAERAKGHYRPTLDKEVG